MPSIGMSHGQLYFSRNLVDNLEIISKMQLAKPNKRRIFFQVFSIQKSQLFSPGLACFCYWHTIHNFILVPPSFGFAGEDSIC